MRELRPVRVGDIPHTAIEMPTFHWIEWWPNGPGMVKAAHTVMSCCSMTFGQHQIVSAVAKQNQQYQRFKFLPRNPVEYEIFQVLLMPTVSLDVISLVASSCGYYRGHIEQHAAQ